MATLYAGDRAPKTYELSIGETAGIDYTTATAWAMSVRRPDGTYATWAVTTGPLTPTAVTLVHLFAEDGSDLPLVGAYDVRALATLPGGEIQSEPVTEFAADPYGVRV
jgi:hypothetical protein